jgi:hypothetical protein
VKQSSGQPSFSTLADMLCHVGPVPVASRFSEKTRWRHISLFAPSSFAFDGLSATFNAQIVF